jgi:acetyl esterase
MPLRPHVEAFLAASAGTLTLAPGAAPHDRDGARFIAELRGASAARRSRLTSPPPVSCVYDQLAGGRVPVRVYLPSEREPCGAVVYAHGGGWVSGDLDMHDGTCRRLAAAAGCVIVSVGYRLAPEHPFGTPLEDVFSALCWTARWAPEWGVDEGALAVAGTSAGANLAAGTAILARARGGPPLATQVLIYPLLDAAMETESMLAYGDGHFLTRDQIRFYWDCYAPSSADRIRPEVSPLRAPALAGLPAGLIVTAEYDPLRDEGEAFARRLDEEAAGARLLRVDGQIHGFLTAFADRDEVAEAIEWVATGLREALLSSRAALGSAIA